MLPHSVSEVWRLTIDICIWVHRSPTEGFFCSGFTLPLSHLLCFIIAFVIICVLLYCFTTEINDSNAEQTHICNLELHHNESRLWFLAIKLVKIPKVVFPLTVPRWLFCCSSYLFVCQYLQLVCLVLSSRKHTYIILTPLNPNFIYQN